MRRGKRCEIRGSCLEKSSSPGAAGVMPGNDEGRKAKDAAYKIYLSPFLYISRLHGCPREAAPQSANQGRPLSWQSRTKVARAKGPVVCAGYERREKSPRGLIRFVPFSSTQMLIAIWRERRCLKVCVWSNLSGFCGVLPWRSLCWLYFTNMQSWVRDIVVCGYLTGNGHEIILSKGRYQIIYPITK